MSGNERQIRETSAMTISDIICQLRELKAYSVSQAEADYGSSASEADAEACAAAVAILSALQDEGIKDPEQVRDLIHDYNALAEQYRKLHQKYEEPMKVLRLGTGTRAACLCPECRNQSRSGNNHCWHCGKRLDCQMGRR